MTTSYTLPKDFNASEFTKDLEIIRKDIYSKISLEDFKHLRKIERYGKLATLFGYLTIWTFPNPITAFLLSLGQFTRWLIAHHVMHRGYDKVPNIPKRYTSKYFAKGNRRFLDWFDWIMPEAWDYEHNILHHYHTGEHHDPDLVERNSEFLRKSKFPKIIKYVFMFFVSISWKFSYYAPTTISCLSKDDDSRIEKDKIEYQYLKDIFKLNNPHIRRLWKKSYLPYGLLHFALIPILFLPFGWTIVLYVLLNKIIAEAITNFHAFLIIGPNHAGDDLFRYDFHYKGKEEFYVTQILSSVNYNCGSELEDYMQIWLNYQIEHHLFPDLPMLKYREVQPKVKELCTKHNLPYIQESVFIRFKKMIDICVGNTNMNQANHYKELST